ncbi:MAG: helix-turn-helix transcriptional regulator [Actinomycetes bacterium]
MERLVRLITVLNAAELGVPADRLLAALQAGEASDDARRKMLDRDIGHLNSLGYDIRNVAPAGADGVYRMFARDNRLRVHLTPAHQAELLRAVVASGRSDLAPHLAADDAPPPRPVRTDADSGRQLDQVLRAAARRCLIRFDYKGRPRVVHPVRVHSGPSGWYLTGREEQQTAVKEFVVSRMGAVTLDAPGSAQPVEQSSRPSLDPLSWEEDPPLDVVLSVQTEHLPLVVTVLGDPAATEDGEGSVRATYRVTHRAVFRRRVYELGTRVTVVSPDELRAEMLDELTAIVEGRP